MQTTVVTPTRAMQIARMPFGPEWSKAYDTACRSIRQAAGLTTDDVSSVICEEDCSAYPTCQLRQAEDRLHEEIVGRELAL